MKKTVIILLGILIFYSCSKNNAVEANYIQFVDPMIGSDYHGNVFVGASVPFGMVQLGPTNLSKGWHWCSGYHFSDSTIIGFSHTHLNGTGIGDLGDLLFMPISGEPTTCKGSFDDLKQGYVSKFSHDQEVVEPGYYKVRLQKHDITAELTATTRVGYHKYTFKEKSNAHVILDLGEGIDWDEPTETYLKQTGDNSIEGYRYSKGWAKDQKIYFVADFSQKISMQEVIEKAVRPRSKDEIDVSKGIVTPVQLDGNNSLEMKVAISYVSIKNARENMTSELPNWGFKEVLDNAQKEWNKELSKIEIESQSESQKRMFYTSLYRTMMSPSIFCDVNNEYRGADGAIHKADKFVPHTIFSLWDTYRALHPLQTIINTERSADWVNSLITIHEQQKELPVWHLVGNETGTMVGVHSIPVIVDACLKGIEGIDIERAYAAIRSFEQRNDRGLDYVRQKEFIPADKINWSVARALEYAIDDYCIALLAKHLKKEDDYNLFIKRSKYYQHYFDSNLKFMRGRLEDGSFRKNYDPFHSIHMEDDYVEGNGWQYTWLVPHDPQGLIDLFGGTENFISKLDSLFLVSSQLNEGASIDISGLIGQYAHGNEPSHATLYLYSFADQPWKTAERVRQVLTEMYVDKPDGLCGNDDCGQMSAWYVFSSLGFYPVNPANGEYIFGSPTVEKATINLASGKTFTIMTENNTDENKYIQSIELNGKPYKYNYIKHSDIMNGGKLVFNMGKEKSNYYKSDN